MFSHTFDCIDCHLTITHTNPGGCGGTGYATTDEGKVCYECCAKRDLGYMAKEGRNILYLTYNGDGASHKEQQRDFLLCKGYRIINWPGTLTFPATHAQIGRHNIAGKRYDVWFPGPDENGDIKATWHGIQYGDNTQIVHCRRIKGA